MSVAHHLKSKKFTIFTCNYAKDYKTFIHHRLVEDKDHPLHFVQKRILRERKEEGLWWHVTVTAQTSRAKVVRSWVRRRMQNAFIAELRERDIAQDGKLVADKTSDIGKHGIEKKRLGTMGLTGSVKLQAGSLAVTAKYEEIRAEIGGVVDALLQGFKKDNGFLGARGDASTMGRGIKKVLSTPRQPKETGDYTPDPDPTCWRSSHHKSSSTTYENKRTLIQYPKTTRRDRIPPKNMIGFAPRVAPSELSSSRRWTNNAVK